MESKYRQPETSRLCIRKSYEVLLEIRPRLLIMLRLSLSFNVVLVEGSLIR